MRLPGRQHRAGGEHGVALDLAAVHDDRAEADEGAVVEDAAVDHGHVADQHVFADERGEPLGGPARPLRIDVDHAAVLDVGARADPDRVDVAAQHAIVPDARLGPDFDVADQLRAGRDEGGGSMTGVLPAKGIKFIA